MPFISETASAIKRRFGFRDHPAPEPERSVPNTPDHPPRSVSREHNGSAATSVIRRIGDSDEDAGECTGPALQSRSFDFNEDPSFWKDHNVQVIIRIRPLSTSEISLQGYSRCVRQDSCQTITWTGHPESRFTFDLVADETVSQEKIFKVAGLPMVENCVAGYNSCMFAYGQTGSGKTHTMLGDIEGGTRRHSVNCGMTPRVFEYLFSRIQKEKEARKDENLRFTCKCSFLEIYNEQILDLLDPSSSNLQLREDHKKGVYVENLKEIEVSSARDLIQQLLQGAANRKVAATNMNRASSRSHSVFTCIIESKWESQGVTRHRFARLNLVDLAGSERQKSSGAEGERLKEATNINKSLSTLGLVIMNLVSISNGKSLHVPYRDSKLTFLLQDSLGGNSKTIIIANISPSSCCSLETLSTLKFGQRAKFIKNNAIINEDASGDVIAMRQQIQQLKKEISRLRGLSKGGSETLENDTLSVGVPGSPGSLNWEEHYGSFSPLTTEKKPSKTKDYEVALVGAFKREKEKDIALQALAAENQAAMQLAKQREDEIQGLKMRLRFRESAVKRLEAVASGKISAEEHLRKEKDEYLKEIEVLRAQVDRNQEVTKFAMENLRLKEEIRRLRSFCEEGERDMMSEQIKVLQNKLLEALDWKLMHGSESSVKYITDNVNDEHDGYNKVNSNVESAKVSAINEENEFLRLQAIQNQGEMETLRKSLNFYAEEKEALEKKINDLVKELEEEKSPGARKEDGATAKLHNPSSEASGFNDQMELKTMVDAIACASEREAEAHERAIKLSKENDELRLKIKILIEDNNRLIDLYEQVTAEKNSGALNDTGKAPQNAQGSNSDSLCGSGEENEFELKRRVENLEYQLTDYHEENEKLMNLYENAMKERDEYKRLLASSCRYKAESEVEVTCPEKLVEFVGSKFIHAKDSHGEAEYPVWDSKIASEDSELVKVTRSEEILGYEGKESSHLCPRSRPVTEETCNGIMDDAGVHDCHGVNRVAVTDMEIDPQALTSRPVLKCILCVKMKLERAQEKLSDYRNAVAMLSSIEKEVIDIDKLSREIEDSRGKLGEKQQELRSCKARSEESKSRKSLLFNKLLALKHSLASFTSSVDYYEQREARARMRVNATSEYMKQKRKDLASLQSCKSEIDVALGKIQQSEAELKNNLVLLKIKLDEENQRQEGEKVLFAIDNIEKANPSQRSWPLKATELLKSEEEKTKLQAEMKLSRDKLGAVRKEFEDLNMKSTKLNTEMHALRAEIEKGSKSLEELELALRNVIHEKETLFEMSENGKKEADCIILDYHQLEFESNLREAESKILEDELERNSKRIKELEIVRAEAVKKAVELVEGSQTISSTLAGMVEELQSLLASVLEANPPVMGEDN